MAGTRRADLSVPGTVPVAELLPVLARELDVPLADDASLTVQGVRGGAVLELGPPRTPALPEVHDDLVEALAAVTGEHVDAWSPEHRHLASRTVGVGLGVVGLTAMVAGTVPSAPLVLATVLALAVLALGTLPFLAVSLASLADDRVPVDQERLAERTRVAHEVLTIATAATGLLVVVAAPATASLGRSGVALALLSCLVVLLRTRWHAAAPEVVVGLASGVAGLVAVAGAVVWLHPEWRIHAGIAALLAGGLLLLGARHPIVPALRRRRLADLGEAACLVAVPPLLVLATGAFSAAGR